MSKTRIQHGAIVFLYGTAGTDGTAFDDTAVTGNRFETSVMDEGDSKRPCHGVSLYAEFKHNTSGKTTNFQFDIHPYDTLELDAIVTVSAKTFLLVHNNEVYVSDRWDLPVTVFGLGFKPKLKGTVNESANVNTGRLWCAPYWVEPF